MRQIITQQQQSSWSITANVFNWYDLAEANEEEADGQQLVCQDFEKKKHIFKIKAHSDELRFTPCGCGR